MGQLITKGEAKGIFDVQQTRIEGLVTVEMGWGRPVEEFEYCDNFAVHF